MKTQVKKVFLKYRKQLTLLFIVLCVAIAFCDIIDLFLLTGQTFCLRRK